ncbi:CHAT domain-containing protein [Polaribacter sp.]|uniref:CHAT domain-containing protein n=1 Tax=Polaribacter sp. TaxID=1920175 RepID=UPI004048341D
MLLINFIVFSQIKNKNKYEKIFNKIDSLYIANAYDNISKYSIDKQHISSKNDSLFIAKIYHKKAKSFYHLNNFYEAINYYNLAFRLAPNSLEGKNLKGIILFDKAYAEYDIEEYVLSYKTVKKAETILTKLPNPDYDYLLDIYIDLGSEASYLGFYDEAEFYLKKGNKIFENHLKNKDTNDSKSASKTVLFLYKFIYIYHLIGDEQQLLAYLNKFESYKKTRLLNETEHLMYAASLNAIGDFYLNFRDKLNDKALEKGIFYINKALQNLDKEKHPKNYLQFLFNKAKYFRYTKEFENALKINSKIQQLTDKNDVRIPFFTAQKGLIFLDSGQKQKALNEFSNMIIQIHSDSTKLNKDFSNFKPSTILNHTGLLVEIADEIFKKYPKDSLLRKQLHQYYKIGLQQFKNCYPYANFNPKLKEYYQKSINGILKTSSKKIGANLLKNVINDIENIENRFAWKAYKQNRILTISKVPDSIFNKETILRNKLIKARKNNHEQEILELKNQLEKHKNQLEESYPNIANYVFQEFDVAVFQKTLNNTTSVLKYKIIEDNLYLFIITKNTINYQSISFKTAQRNLIENYIKLLRNKREDKVLASKISEILIPFSLPKTKSLVIVPDDILLHLPFETLVKNKNYMVFDYTFSYASYLVFANSKNQINTKNNAIVFSPTYVKGNSSASRDNYKALKGAQKEAEEIANIFNYEIFKDNNATKANFLAKATKANLLHLAMHATINNEKPELSYFLFSKNDDNKLYLEELHGMQLKADLAVLSACNTGTSLQNSSGITSLQRAFTLAGVPTTVSSLWEAPDETTKEIMISFYNNFKKGLSKSEALQKAKLSYVKNTKDINLMAPYYWAGFVVFGDDAPIAVSTNTNFVFCIVIVVTLFLVFLLLLKRLQNR